MITQDETDAMSLKQMLRAEILCGEEMSEDPVNANLPDLVIRVTTIYSPWYAQSCKVCRHKFREEDSVRLCPQCDEAYHDDQRYGLHCWQAWFEDGRRCRIGRVDHFYDEPLDVPACDYRSPRDLMRESHAADGGGALPSERLVSQFLAGLEGVWRPFGRHKNFQVRRSSSLAGQNCPWCRFKVRAGDWVVACPCGCGAHFHQDVFRHLTCWNDWNGVTGKDYCANTGRPFGEKEAVK